MYKIYHQCIPSVYDVLEMINQAITYLNLQNTFSFTAVCKTMDKTDELLCNSKRRKLQVLFSPERKRREKVGIDPPECVPTGRCTQHRISVDCMRGNVKK